jgi:putative transcriptional regulator
MEFSLKELRARKSWTQAETAEKLGISPQTYNAWEKNPGRVKIQNAYKMSQIFDVSVNEIFFGDVVGK